MHEAVDTDPFSDVQSPYSLGAVELMGRHGEEVDVHGLYVDRKVGHSLNSIGVEENSPLPAKCADLTYGLNCAYLIVCKDHRHEDRLVPDRFFKIPEAYPAFRIHGKKGYFEAIFSKIFRRLDNGGMLNFCGYDVISLGAVSLSSSLKGPVVRLRAAAGEKDFVL